ncbi:MAG: potassium-transporting ATPase subunit C [Planctomycetaceae bacterium]
MASHLRAILWLLLLSVVVCSVVYPGVLWLVGQAVFHDKVEGSLIHDERGNNSVGSRLIAQPFTGAQYFQPRPSAVSYNAAASGATNWGANNYLLRDRVARMLGPLVKYAGGSKKGEPVGPDIERWFHEDRYQGRPGIVAQWAALHSTLAANWVKAAPMNAEFVTAWKNAHPQEVAQWRNDNPDNPKPNPEDLAVAFFTSFSREYPGAFPGVVERPTAEGHTETAIGPVSEGADIRSIFFDMWRQDHPDVDLTPVPADMVMASGSGLDPHITLNNALYQLERVADAWAAQTDRNPATVRSEIESLLREKAEAPLGGLVGVEIVNVLELNLGLRERFAAKASR